MDGYSAKQVRDAEVSLIAAGIPLMERSGTALAKAIAQLLVERPQGYQIVLMLVGGGNNGGDALYAAAELASRGVEVQLIPVRGKVHEEAMRVALEGGARLLVPVDASEDDVVATIEEAVPHVSLVVDGILGTGSVGRGALAGTPRAAVKALLRAFDAGADCAVVAVDIPSGTDPDTGDVHDSVVLPADTTVTFGVCKAGLLTELGRRYAGRIMVADIGLLPQLEGVEPLIRTVG